MRKRLLIGVIVVVLALGTIGAAFATGMDFSNVGELSLGYTEVSQVNCDFVGYELFTGGGIGVVVDGVYISFDKDLHSDQNSTVIFVSLRDANFNELAYCVATVPASTTLWAGNKYKLPCADGITAKPEDVYYVKVTVAEQSAYSYTGAAQDYGESAGIIIMPGASYTHTVP